jgi:hypothetical protein
LPSWQRKQPGESLWPRLFGCAPHVTGMSGKDVARVDVRLQQKGRMMEHAGQLGATYFSKRLGISGDAGSCRIACSRTT